LVKVRVALGDAPILANHALAILDRDVVSLGKRLGCGGHVLAHHVDSVKNSAHEISDYVRMVAVEIVPHRPKRRR
jgi:hypothetical protein